MALLGRALMFLTRLLFNLLVWLFIQLMRFLQPFVIALLRWLFRLVTTAIVATISGPGEYIERLASEWTRRSIISGMSLELIDTTHRINRFLARATIVLGWIVTVLFTVIIVRVVFGFFI